MTEEKEMELSQVTAERRSIRDFKEGMSINADQIREMVACAQLAPSWKNSQTGRYYEFEIFLLRMNQKDSDMLLERIAEINEKALPAFNVNSSKNACALVITTFEMKRAGFDREGNPDNELGDQWGAYDLGLQNQNFLLKAREMGYDTLVMGIRDGQALRDILEIPDSQQVVAVIAVGVRETTPEMPKRKDTDSILKVY